MGAASSKTSVDETRGPEDDETSDAYAARTMREGIAYNVAKALTKMPVFQSTVNVTVTLPSNSPVLPSEIIMGSKMKSLEFRSIKATCIVLPCDRVMAVFLGVSKEHPKVKILVLWYGDTPELARELSSKFPEDGQIMTTYRSTLDIAYYELRYRTKPIEPGRVIAYSTYDANGIAQRSDDFPAFDAYEYKLATKMPSWRRAKFEHLVVYEKGANRPWLEMTHDDFPSPEPVGRLARPRSEGKSGEGKTDGRPAETKEEKVDRAYRETSDTRPVPPPTQTGLARTNSLRLIKTFQEESASTQTPSGLGPPLKDASTKDSVRTSPGLGAPLKGMSDKDLVRTLVQMGQAKPAPLKISWPPKSATTMGSGSPKMTTMGSVRPQPAPLTGSGPPRLTTSGSERPQPAPLTGSWPPATTMGSGPSKMTTTGIQPPLRASQLARLGGSKT